MDLVGEVERGRAGREIDDVAARGEGVDALRVELPAERVEQGAGLAGVLAGLQELAQPRDAGVDPRLLALHALLVPPVRRDPELRLGVHLAGADLHLQGPAARPHDRGVQRSVAVRLRIGDVVVELTGDMGPAPVHDAERRVALGDGIDEHPDGPQVEDLLDAALLDTALSGAVLPVAGRLDAALPRAWRLPAHLPPDAVDVLGAAGHLRVHAGPGEVRAEPAHHVLDVTLAVDAALVELAGDTHVRRRVRFAEREILDLPLALPDPEAARERRVDLQAFAGEALPLRAGALASGAQPVQGQRELHDQDPHVVHGRRAAACAAVPPASPAPPPHPGRQGRSPRPRTTGARRTGAAPRRAPPLPRRAAPGTASRPTAPRSTRRPARPAAMQCSSRFSAASTPAASVHDAGSAAGSPSPIGPRTVFPAGTASAPPPAGRRPAGAPRSSRTRRTAAAAASCVAPEERTPGTGPPVFMDSGSSETDAEALQYLTADR